MVSAQLCNLILMLNSSEKLPMNLCFQQMFLFFKQRHYNLLFVFHFFPWKRSRDSVYPWWSDLPGCSPPLDIIILLNAQIFSEAGFKREGGETTLKEWVFQAHKFLMNIKLWILIQCIVFKKAVNVIWFISTGTKLADIQKCSVFCKCKLVWFYCLQWDYNDYFCWIFFQFSSY